jgi:[protein-PII] uridylyltransferase
MRVQSELEDIEWLVALVPEWAPARCRPQRNPFHLYSLDRHLVHAAHELALLPEERKWAVDALADVDLPDALTAGTWLHDLGKAHGEPHSLTGIAPAQAVARRMGLDEVDVERIGLLVEHHLLLPEAGTRRDVSDPAEARAVADVVGSTGVLASLHLLSAADARATGPTAWTPWKSSLVSVLVTKVRAVLQDHDPATLSDGAAATARAAEELGPSLGVQGDVVADHLAQLPERYASAVSPRAVVRHAGLASPAPQPGEVRTRVTRTEVAGDETTYDELDVIALDTPGLFTKVAGVVALHGGSILEAHAHTRVDGTAVDTLTVVVPSHATGSWWVTVEGDLAEAVAGRLAVRARVARKRAGERRRLAKLPEVPTVVTTSADAAGNATLVEVRTLDRIGVLYRIASALAELELDMVVAKVATEGHEAVDVFSVRDGGGSPLDVDHQRELELAITAALAE